MNNINVNMIAQNPQMPMVQGNYNTSLFQGQQAPTSDNFIKRSGLTNKLMIGAGGIAALFGALKANKLVGIGGVVLGTIGIVKSFIDKKNAQQQIMQMQAMSMGYPQMNAIMPPVPQGTGPITQAVLQAQQEAQALQQAQGINNTENTKAKINEEATAQAPQEAPNEETAQVAQKEATQPPQEEATAQTAQVTQKEAAQAPQEAPNEETAQAPQEAAQPPQEEAGAETSEVIKELEAQKPQDLEAQGK